MVVVNGEVIGIWARTVKKNIVQIDAEYFGKPSQAVLNQIEQAAGWFGMFLGKIVSI
jgi:hypothetical protein